MAGNAATLGTGRTGGRDATTGVIAGRFALAVGMPDVAPPKGWRWTALSSVAQLESGHTPSRKHPEYWDGGIPWIGIKDATENHGRVLRDTYQHVAELGLQNSSARLLPTNTVCLSRTASVGFVVVMGCPMATSQDFINWVCGPNIDAHFLKYVLLAENEALWRFASGTTHQTIYYPEAKAFHVCLPPISEQRAIASVLGALDDKIELNRRMNETLEALAQSLFKSWFVDATQSALPKGWRESTVGAELTTLLGGTPSRVKPAFWEGGDIPWINSGKANEFRIIEPSEFITKAGFENSSTKLLPERTTIIAITGATLGQVSLLEIEACANQSVVGVVGSESIPNEFVYFWIKENIDVLVSWQTGGAQQHINKDNVNELKIVCPPENVMRAYTDAVRPMFDRIKNNCFESRTLAALRDALLPKLLSGELRVPSGEKQGEKVE